MINVSDAFKEALKNRSDFQYYANVTLADGTELGEFGPGDIELKNNKLLDGVFSASFPLGMAISRCAEFGLLNDDDSLSDYDFYGARVRLRLSFVLDDGTTEEINLGSFTVFTPNTRGEVISLTAYDDMWKTDKPYTSGLVFPAALDEVFMDACDSCGLAFETSSFANSAFVVQEKPSGDYTFRQIFGFIAMLAGGNARINRDGYMQILSYDQAANSATAGLAELSEWKDLDYDTDDIVITGVQMSVYDSDTGEEKSILSGANGYVITLEENPLFVGQEEAGVALVGGAVNGIQFRRFSGRHVSNPLVEFMDSVKIIDRNGRVYYSIVTDIDFSFLGLTGLLNSAESAREVGATYSPAENRAVMAARKLVAAERSAREAAIAALQETLDNASGFYSTDVSQSDGSTIRYLHDKPTIAESQNVIKITADAIGFSTDGGATYPFGIQVNGDVIAKILSAEGVNADWINAGALVVKDADGNTIFEADKDNGTVFVNILSGTESVFKVDEEGNLSASRVNIYAPEKPDTFPSGSGFTVWGDYGSWFDVLSIFKGPLDDADVPTVDIYGSSGYGAMGYGSARFNFLKTVFRGNGVFVQDAFGLGEQYRLISEYEINDYIKDYLDTWGGGGTGESGATFTPSVSSDGTLSWTNNGGLANPAPVNIMGPAGADGATGPQGPKGDTGEVDYSRLASYLPLSGGAMTGAIDFTAAGNILDFGTTGWFRGLTASGGRFDIFGYSNPTQLQVGGSYPALALRGKNERPTYNGADMALKSDIPTAINGADGVSCTHSWNGTTLTVTSASGTSSANLKGDKGDTGATGATGPQGPQGEKGAWIMSISIEEVS